MSRIIFILLLGSLVSCIINNKASSSLPYNHKHQICFNEANAYSVKHGKVIANDPVLKQIKYNQCLRK